MEYKKEFKGLYQFSNRVSDIWKGHKEHFNGTYKIVDSFVKKEPVYRDDYIEPYDYKYDDYVVIEDIETGKQQELDYYYFSRMFKPLIKEILFFKTRDELNDYMFGKNANWVGLYQTKDGFELEIGVDYGKINTN